MPQILKNTELKGSADRKNIMSIAANPSIENTKRGMTKNTEQKNTMVSFGRLQSHYITFGELWIIDGLRWNKKVSTNNKIENVMQTKTLNAKNLKAVLWDSISLVKDGKMTYADADSIATSAREILRATHTQLRIAQASNRNVPDEVIEFSEGVKMIGAAKPRKLKNA